jgi:hypothetical protein
VHYRAKLVRLTAEGRSVLDWITERQVTWVNRLAAGLSETDLTDGLELLRGVARGWSVPSSSAETGRGQDLRPGRALLAECRIRKGDDHGNLR